MTVPNASVAIVGMRMEQVEVLYRKGLFEESLDEAISMISAPQDPEIRRTGFMWVQKCMTRVNGLKGADYCCLVLPYTKYMDIWLQMTDLKLDQDTVLQQ